MRTIRTKGRSADEKRAKFYSLESQRAVSSKGRKPIVSIYRVNDSEGTQPLPQAPTGTGTQSVCGKMMAGYD